MSFKSSNRYSSQSYHGLNDYRSYSYQRTTPPPVSWRPPRYVAPLTSTLQSVRSQRAQQEEKKAVESAIIALTSLPATVTDELQAEVDYNMQEIDNIMICKGKIIEIQSSELSAKNGLIAKCMFVNKLLRAANLNEQSLSCDPAFIPEESKAVIRFIVSRDAEEFINSHNCKYRIVLQNTSTSPEALRQSRDSALPVSSSSFSVDQNSSKINSRSIKFDDVVTKTSYDSSNNLVTTSVEPISGQTTVSFTISDESKSSGSNKQDNTLYDTFNDDFKFESEIGPFSNDTNSSSNNGALSVKRDSSVEGYETLTIKARLKQRVGPNRTRHVTLRDIDSIMRNVVTIVQNEFMKRFPSATSVSNTPSITDGSEFLNSA